MPFRFQREVLSDNVSRLVAIAAIGSAVNLLIIFLKFPFSGGFDLQTWYRVAWVVAGLLFVALVGRPGRRAYGWQKACFLCAASLSLLFSALITAEILSEEGYTFLYIINILLTSGFFFLSLPEMLGVIVPSVAVLAIAMFFGGEKAITQTNNAFNIIAVTAFASMVSRFTWKAREQAFAYARAIERNNETLADLANRDGLTELPNRRKVENRIAELDALAVREGIAVGVLMIDIDDFKLYNDTKRHLEGDDALTEAARAMRGALQRESDFLGRYGGEEFIALLSGVDGEGARAVAERLRRAVESLAIPHETSRAGMLTISVGVASGVPAPERRIADLVGKADEALYRAKSSGKNRVET